MLNDLKAEFSHAYVRAVAHAAGYFVQETNRAFDADGVDLTLLSRGPGGAVSISTTRPPAEGHSNART